MRNIFRRKTLKYPDTTPFPAIPFKLVDSGELKLPTGYGAIYEQSAPVQAVISLISRSLGQTTLRAYLRSPEGPRELHYPNRLALLLRQAGLTYALARDLCIWGESFHLLVGEKWPTELVRLDPESVTVEGRGSLITGFRLGNDLYQPDDVLYIRHHSVTDPLRGLSPLKALRPILVEDAAARTHRLASWSGRAGQFILRPLDAPEWSDTARTRFEEALRARGPSDVAVLEEGMTPGDASTASAKDSEYLDSRRFVYEQVAAAFGVPSAALSGTGSDRNMQEAHRTTYQDAVAPLGSTISDAINEQLVGQMFGTQASGGRIYVSFDLEEKMRGSFQQQADVYATALAGAAYLTVDEVRNFLHLPEMAESDSLTPVRLRLEP